MKSVIFWFVLEVLLQYGDINVLYCDLFVDSEMEFEEIYELEEKEDNYENVINNYYNIDTY